MTPELQRIVDAHGSFPPAEQVLAGFDAVLDLPQAGQSSDVADALLALIDQLSAVAPAVPDPLAARLVDWAEAALQQPEAPGRQVAAILVNAGTARSLAVLQDLSARDGRFAAVAATAVADHPITRAQARPGVVTAV